MLLLCGGVCHQIRLDDPVVYPPLLGYPPLDPGGVPSSSGGVPLRWHRNTVNYTNKVLGNKY